MLWVLLLFLPSGPRVATFAHLVFGGEVRSGRAGHGGHSDMRALHGREPFANDLLRDVQHGERERQYAQPDAVRSRHAV